MLAPQLALEIPHRHYDGGVEIIGDPVGFVIVIELDERGPGHHQRNVGAVTGGVSAGAGSTEASRAISASQRVSGFMVFLIRWMI